MEKQPETKTDSMFPVHYFSILPFFLYPVWERFPNVSAGHKLWNNFKVFPTQGSREARRGAERPREAQAPVDTDAELATAEPDAEPATAEPDADHKRKRVLNALPCL